MTDTKIEWAEKSWNPITGCSKISEGCQNCYAERMAKRLAGRYGYPKDEPFRVTIHREKISEPFKWKKPKKIFVVSMGDLFHPDIPDWAIYEILIMAKFTAPWHKYLILTKRPERMKEMISKGIRDAPNIWLGVSVENQKRADERIPVLLQISAKVRFVSIEPMLERIDLLPYLDPYSYSLNLVIAGCESGPKRRKAETKWFRDLRDQCLFSDTPFFLKQMETGEIVIHRPWLDGYLWEQWPE